MTIHFVPVQPADGADHGGDGDAGGHRTLVVALVRDPGGGRW